MIADPFGNRLVAAAHPLDPTQRVKYLVEVCDPCQTIWYPVNGVQVSDFYTPRYFDPVAHAAATASRAARAPAGDPGGRLPPWIDPEGSGLYQLEGGESSPSASRPARSARSPRRCAPGRRQPADHALTWATLRPACTAVAADAPRGGRRRVPGARCARPRRSCRWRPRSRTGTSGGARGPVRQHPHRRRLRPARPSRACRSDPHLQRRRPHAPRDPVGRGAAVGAWPGGRRGGGGCGESFGRGR